MIKNVNDIHLLLEKLNKFKNTAGVKKADLYPLIKRPDELKIWTIEYDELFDLCKSLKLLEKKNDRVVLTDHGKNIIDMYDGEIYLNEEQKRYLIENCIIENQSFTNELEFLRLFTFNEEKNAFLLNEKNYPIKANIRFYLLTGLGLINKINNFTWEISSEYSQNVEILQYNEGKRLSQKQLDEILKEQKEIGNRAEDLTMKYEIRRLQRMGLTEESKNVQIISKSNVNKGYDIESFSSRSIRPNLFIEVKGRKRHNTSFFISSNEIKTSKKLRKQYAIYFWNNIGAKNPPEKPMKIIKDPYTKLKIKECDNCIHYLIDLID